MTPVCNLCGSPDFNELNGRPNAICAKCGAYERTRIMKLSLDRMGVGPETAILHLAPERGLYSWLSTRSKAYVAGDIDLVRYSHIPSIRKIDLCDPSSFAGLGPFDLIIHSHVIEHVPCNYTVVLIRLHKLLKAGGAHVFSLPIYGTAYEEDLGPLTEEQKTARFGQFDHCRRFSPKDIARTLGALFRIAPDYDLREHFSAHELNAANIPEAAWRGYTGHSVFVLGEDDILV